MFLSGCRYFRNRSCVLCPVSCVIYNIEDQGLESDWYVAAFKDQAFQRFIFLLMPSAGIELLQE